MIHEIRTYNLKTGQLQEYWKRFGEKLPERVKFSKLAGHWYTEAGPLNQMVAIWPYESAEQRIEVRREVESGANPIWPPATSDLVNNMESRIYQPAPFMTPMDENKIGPLYEIRYYTYAPEHIPQVLEAWGKAVPARVKLSPLAGCWYSEAGGQGNFVHMWAYSSFEERLKIRKEGQESGIWPPRGTARPVHQETKILFPAPFSPMQ